MKVQAPRGCRALSIAGSEIVLEEGGAVEVPDRVAHDLIAFHRFKKAGAVEAVGSAPKGKTPKP